MRPECDLNRGWGRSEVVGARSDRLRNRYPQFAIAIENALRAENREPHDLLRTRRVAKNVTLRGLLPRILSRCR
jgi:hypothetical protein